MKFFTMMVVLFLGIFLFFESDEYSMYTKNSKIEKAPTYIRAQISNIKEFEGYSSLKGNKFDDSYQLKYKFKTTEGEFTGRTNLLTKDSVNTYLKDGYIEIVYYSISPNINTVKTYFKEGESKKIFYQYSVVIALFSLLLSLVLSLFFSWKLGWLKKSLKQ